MKKVMIGLSVCAFLAVTAYGGKLSLKVNGGGTYLIGGDFNKACDGFRDYEHSIAGVGETIVDNLKKLRLGFQFGGEVLYEISPRLAAGVEIGYLSASVDSGFERTAFLFKQTLSPTLSAVPIMLNVHYFLPLFPKIRLNVMAGAGAFISRLTYGYDIVSTSYPYSGTWKPEAKTVFGAKAGVGLEYSLSNRIALTFDIGGRFAEVQGLAGPWSGTYSGVQKNGTGTLYYYEYDGQYPMIGIWETLSSAGHYQNAREAKISLSGLSALVGVRVKI
jgi:hypothetical protein